MSPNSLAAILFILKRWTQELFDESRWSRRIVHVIISGFRPKTSWMALDQNKKQVQHRDNGSIGLIMWHHVAWIRFGLSHWNPASCRLKTDFELIDRAPNRPDLWGKYHETTKVDQNCCYLELAFIHLLETALFCVWSRSKKNCVTTLELGFGGIEASWDKIEIARRDLTEHVVRTLFCFAGFALLLLNWLIK